MCEDVGIQAPFADGEEVAVDGDFVHVEHEFFADAFHHALQGESQVVVFAAWEFYYLFDEDLD